MDFALTEGQRMARDLAREFAQREIAPVARENDRQQRFPREIIQKMAPLGLLAGPIPQEYGGMGLDHVSQALICEEIGRACMSTLTTMLVQVSLVQMPILNWGSEEQKRAYLPRLARGEIIGCFALTEPNVGSDAASIETSAARGEDGWALNGNKMWISNGGVADVAIVFAQTNRELAHRGIAAFLVEQGTPGFTSQDIHGKLGLRASNTAALFFEECQVPPKRVLGEVGQGYRIALSTLEYSRFNAAAGFVGLAQACLDAAVKYAQERVQFGRPIGSFQLIQEMIAEMATEVDAARYLVYRVGYLRDQGQAAARESSVAKYYAAEVAIRCADRALQVHGGYGYADEFPVERYYRDARVASIYEGTSQIQKLLIGRDILGMSAFS